MEARATEFQGITYRSKCEAMFALWLSKKNSQDVRIEYEPDWCEIGDYVPDFAVIRPILDDGHRIPRFCTSVELIEYKPSRPTFTYVDEVFKKLHCVANRELSNGISEILLTVYFGSIYTEDRGIFYFQSHGSFSSSCINWIGDYEKSIRDFRFDLEAASCS
jgi:hypothetical protein